MPIIKITEYEVPEVKPEEIEVKVLSKVKDIKHDKLEEIEEILNVIESVNNGKFDFESSKYQNSQDMPISEIMIINCQEESEIGDLDVLKEDLDAFIDYVFSVLNENKLSLKDSNNTTNSSNKKIKELYELSQEIVEKFEDISNNSQDLYELSKEILEGFEEISNEEENVDLQNEFVLICLIIICFHELFDFNNTSIKDTMKVTFDFE